MSKKIIIQKCNFNTIYFLFYIISGIIENIIKYKYHPTTWEEPEPNDKVKYFLPYRILLLYASNLSDFLAIIPYFIRKKLLKSNKEIEKSKIYNLNNENEEKSESNQLIYNNIKDIQSTKRKKLIIIYTIIIATLDFLPYFTLCLYNIIFDDKQPYYNDFNCFVPLYNIFQFVSSYLILKMHFYKLQYFSLFLSIGLFIIILIFDLITIINEKAIDGYIYLFLILNYLFLAVEYSLGKRVMLYGYISIYLLLVIRGLFKIIIGIIFSLFLYIFDKEKFFGNMSYCLEGIKLFYFLFNIIIYFFESIFLWIIIDRFSPNHVPLAILIKQIVDFIISLILTYNNNDSSSFNWDLYIRIFLYAILIIGVLIHNEIIVINICGLASDTKYFLDLKLKNEELYSDSDEPEVLQKFETIELEEKIKNDE